MVVSLFLISCALVTSQPDGRAEAVPSPHVSRGQEFLFSGSYVEEAAGKEVQFIRGYRLECRVFVLDVSPRGADVALFTLLRPKTPPNDRDKGPTPTSVRLELVRLDPQGQTSSATGAVLPDSLEGPASLETGMFVPLAGKRKGNTWEVPDEGRPLHAWKVVGREMIAGTACLKLDGVQQSDDWERPRADRTAWRRHDVVWLVPGLGIAAQVERTLERREPLRRDPTQKSVTRYTLDSRVVYPGPLYEDRRREILLAQKLGETTDTLIHERDPNGPQAADAVLSKIKAHAENHPATPYREALVQVQRRLDAVQRGEVPPVPQEAEPSLRKAVLGRPAPDFVATDLTTQKSARLHKLLGKPILMVFYNPTSKTAAEVLRFAQNVQDANHGEVTVLGFAMSDETGRAVAQWKDMHLRFPILSGLGLRLTFGVEATPKFVVLDAAGVVRGGHLGWGQETAALVEEELKPARPAGVR